METETIAPDEAESSTTSPEADTENQLDSIMDVLVQKEQEQSDDEPEAADGGEQESRDPEPEETEEEDIPPTGLEKRINTLTAQKNKFRDQLEEAQARIDELENAPAPKAETSAQKPGPLVGVRDIAELEKIVTAAKQMEQWAFKNRDGGELPGKDGEEGKYIGADEVSELFAEAKEIINSAPDAYQNLQYRQESLNIAQQSYPWLSDNSSNEFQLYQNELARWGDFKVKDLPNAELLFANALAGEIQRQARLKKQSEKTSPADVPTPPTSQGQPRKTKPSAKSAEAAKQRYMEDGDDTDSLDNYLETFIT